MAAGCEAKTMTVCSKVFQDGPRELEQIESLHTSLQPAVSIFGSARVPVDSPEYRSAFEIGHLLAKAGFTVISGGGPGVMRAAIEGARSASGRAVGFHIALPFEHIDTSLQDLSLKFENFFTRKLAFAHCSDAFIVMPGGMGTLDELFEILTLIQTVKIKNKHVILYNYKFWSGLIQWLDRQVASKEYINIDEATKITVFDTEKDVLNCIMMKLSSKLLET